MSNETKRDVFNEVLDEWQVDETMPDANWKYPDFKLVRIKEERFKDRYAAALPDDLPVIPEGVSDLLVTQKQYHLPLSNVLGLVHELSVVCQQPGNPSLNWVANHEYTFARAWVLGVWRVEETGEIVKLEAVK